MEREVTTVRTMSQASSASCLLGAGALCVLTLATGCLIQAFDCSDDEDCSGGKCCVNGRCVVTQDGGIYTYTYGLTGSA